MTVTHPRRIKSFVRRPGRMTTGQRRALDQLLPRFGLPYETERPDLESAFGRSSPRVLDIGFGDGEALLTSAARWPDIDYLGVEVHAPGIGHLLALLERSKLTNVRIVDHDAVEVVERMLPDAAFDAVNLFFPDPWPKKRHHKRRIVQPAFVRSVARILKPRGLLHIATDWADYAEHAKAVMAQCRDFEQLHPADVENDPLAFRAPTKFEARGRRLGHDICDLYYCKS
jgi:tRNA (guanine-N7-)-methyltransferase